MTSDVRCNTCDIYPTLLDITGVSVEGQCPLDGVSLLPLLEGEMDARPQPMGFWDCPIGGIGTPSDAWMAELLAAQQEGREGELDQGKLRLDAAEIKQQYSLTSFPGHSAWIDGDWKLHRIEPKEDGNVRLELYNLADDPMETTDLLDSETERVVEMSKSLEGWLESVARSLNGEDY